MPVKLLTSGGGGVNLVPSSSIASDQTMYLPTSGTSGGTVLCTDSSGNLGLGTSSPSAKLDIQTNVNGQSWASYRNLNAGGTSGYFLGNDQFSDVGALGVLGSSSGAFGGGNSVFVGTWRAYPLAFITNNAERMRINSNGNLLIGCTTEAANETHIVLSTNSGTTRWSVGPWSTVSNNFYITATSASQGVYLNGLTATSWSALSDERWKTELEPITNAAEKVSTLRAVTGVYTNDASKKRKPFLIAQDVLAVLPEAVDTENSEKYGLSYTEVIPLLVAAIKELSAQNKELTQRIEALEYTK